jgi:uncharacterized Tic20 family protein
MATPPPPQPPYGGGAQQPLTPSDEKLWSTLIQVGGLLFGFIPALIGYLVLKDRGPYVRAYSVTALNFQLTLLIAYVVGWVLAFVLVGFLIIAAVWVVNIVFSIIAAVKANSGEWYTYPLSIPFVK